MAWQESPRELGFANAYPAYHALSSFSVTARAGIYRFSAGTAGAGQTIALIELGGGFPPPT